MRKDFDGKAWATTHGGDFRELIAKARRKEKEEEEEREGAKASGTIDEEEERRADDSEIGKAEGDPQQLPVLNDVPKHAEAAAVGEISIAGRRDLEERSPFFKDPPHIGEPRSASTVDLTSQG